MPKCPKCGTHYDDLFDVSICISSHHEERAAAILRPRVIEKPKPKPVVEARWINLPTGLFQGTSDQMQLLDEYFNMFAKAFDTWIDFPTRANGDNLWGDEPTMMYDSQIDSRIPIELMPNRKKKSTHGYFKYKLKRYTLGSVEPGMIDTMPSEAVLTMGVDNEPIWLGRKPFISLAPGVPMQSVICTLAHEMCHYAQYIEVNRWITRQGLGGGWGKAHGPTFVKQMKAFNDYARSMGSDIRVDKKCHSGRGHDKEVYDRIEWVRENLKKGDVFYWEWEHTDKSRDPYVGVYQCRGRYAHRVKGHYIQGTRVHDMCIPWSCIKYVWRPDFPEEHEPDNEQFVELKELIDVLPNKGRVI